MKRRTLMKNTFFKKLVALSLAVLMLVGSGIGAALAGIDLAGLVGIKASAEDPKNEILYDAENALYFTVDSAANIVGTNKAELPGSAGFNNGTYTIPATVTDSNTGISYNVFKINHFAFINSRKDIKKIIVPDNFRSLTLTNAAFAGMDNLVEVEFNQPNVTTEGPLFELVAEYSIGKWSEDVSLSEEELNAFITEVLGSDFVYDGNFANLTDFQKLALKNACENSHYIYTDTGINKKVGDVNNCFPQRDSYGVVQLNETEDLANVIFYNPKPIEGISSDYYERWIHFEESIGKLTNINTVSREDIDNWHYEASIVEEGIAFDSVVSESGTIIGLYDYTTLPIDPGTVSITIEEVPSEEVGIYNAVDGNGAYSKAYSVIMHKSPVVSISLGPKVTSIPDYMFYDTDIKSVPLSNIESIGKMAFVDCDGLTSLNLENVKSIDELAFAACDGLTEVTIPEDMQFIGGGAFYLCDSISTVKYNAVGCTVDDKITKPEKPLEKHPELPVPPKPVTPFNSTGVTTMIFGADVNEIPAKIGKDVPTLSKVMFLADTATLVIDNNAFNGSDSINSIEVIDPEKWQDVNIGNNNDSLMYDDIDIEQHSHQFVPTTVEATCSCEGYTIEVCICGAEQNKQTTDPKLPHTLVFVSTTEPSCEGKGYDLYRCEVCGEAVTQNEQAALGHDYSDSVTYPATCTEPERVVGTCSRCHNVVTTEGSPALGHDFGEYIYNNNATTRNDGTETARCSRCGVVDERTVPGTRIVDHLAIAAMTNGAEKTVEYGSKAVVFSKAFNVPSDYHLGIFVDGKLVAEGNNEEVTYTVDKITEDTTFTTFILDANGNIATETPRKIDKAKVNNNFFSRIIAFFKGLFGLLPTVYFGK